MLCGPCIELIARILAQDTAVQDCLAVSRTDVLSHGCYQDVRATCENGCKLCRLFCKSVEVCLIRDQRTPDTLHLDEAVPLEILHRRNTDDPCFELVVGIPDPLRCCLELFRPTQNDSTTTRFTPAGHLPSAVARLPVGDTAVIKARTWLQQCRSQHSECERKRSVIKQPIRVIDVGIEGSSLRPQLKITGLMLGEYATLSHCWGLSKRLTTTRANIERHLTNGFSLSELPATFRDAILFTRLLRIRYLWIDALCIVQDDIGDWNRHAVLMHSIFGNAVLSLAALDSPDSNAGFLTTREDHSIVFDIHDTTVGVRARLLPTGDAINCSILETRAWCFQERLLPPAVLHFGRAQLYWECLGAEASESLYEFEMVNQSTHPLQRLNTQQDPDSESWHKTWLGLVEQYSERLITRPGDRLPALRGLAEYVKRTIPKSARGSYTYGIWSEHAYAGLLWQRTDAQYMQDPQSSIILDATFRRLAGTVQTKADGNEDRAPSWSWASLNQPVNWTRVVQAMRTSTYLDVKLNMNIPKTGSLLSGTISRWAIGFEGYILEGTCRRYTDSGLACFEVSDHRGDDIVCILDRADEFVFARCCAVYMASFRPTLGHTSPPDLVAESLNNVGSAHTAFILLIEEARSTEYRDQAVYRRTGIGSGPTDVVGRLFNGAEMRSFVVY